MSENAELRPDAAGDAAAALAERVVANLGSAVHASQETLRLPFLCLLAEGHVLVEDVPGVGKTVLAKALARSLELGFHRVQFTPDLLPADVTGVNVFDRRSGATLVESIVRLLPKDRDEKIAVKYADIARLEFSGRDTAAGKSFETWVKKYQAKKAAGEKNIGIEPEKLD